MHSLPVLLKKLETLHRQHVQLEQEIASTERAIVAQGKAPPKPRRPKPAQVVELVRAIVLVLQKAGQPLPPSEIARRLDMPTHMVDYRLLKARAAGFVERMTGGRYRVSSVVPPP